MQLTYSYSMADKNSFGIQTSAGCHLELNRLSDLKLLPNMIKSWPNYCCLGEGSNVLLHDLSKWLVIAPRFLGISLKQLNDKTLLTAYAGENWHDLVQYTVQKNLWGIENLAFIPGSVGASVIQNIGAYGVELSNTLVSVLAYDFHQHDIVTLLKSDCMLGYRDSLFKRNSGRYCVIAVTLQLQKRANPIIHYPGVETELKNQNKQHDAITPLDMAEAITQIRKRKIPLPSDLPNAGSFFKNPIISKAAYAKLQLKDPKIPGFVLDNDQVKVPAAYLIDQLGWKGYVSGDVIVHHNQPLVLINTGSATATHIKQLASKITQSVRQHYGITLEQEVRDIGALVVEACHDG